MGVSRRQALALFGAASAAGVGVGAVLDACAGGQRSVDRLYGVLDAGRATSSADLRREHDAGIRLRVLAASWRSFEPEPGRWDAAYAAQVRRRAATYREAGFRVVLDPGMQHPPSWAMSEPAGRFVNQYGTPYVTAKIGAGGVNAVFNDAIRRSQERYLWRLVRELDDELYAVRLGWGYYGELGYPNPSFGGERNCYWAYDDIAQGRRPGLPRGVAACPVPGWKPGASDADAQHFIDWYLASLHNYHDWQIHAARRHFSGILVMLYGSNTVVSTQVQRAASAGLAGGTSAERTGLLQRGFDYTRFVDGITDRRTAVCTTWLDCPFGNDTSPDPTQWTPVHHLAELARSKKLSLWAENTGGNTAAQMETCFNRVATYDVRVLSWAFENQLFTEKYASLGSYAKLISKNGGP